MLRENQSGEYGVVETEVWCSEAKIQDDLFKEGGTLLPMQLRFIDL